VPTTRREELQGQIETLERILNSGASSVSEDGQSTTFDLDSVRDRLLDLKTELNRIDGRRAPRPMMGQINLSGG
jgi:hypothetical protein